MNKLLIFSLLLLPLCASNLLLQDQRNIYAKDSLSLLGASLISAGIMANSSIDSSVSDYYEQNIRSSRTDAFAKEAKKFGNKRPLLGALGVISAVGFVLESKKSSPLLYTFGTNTLRSILVGLAPLIAGQNLLGAHRPRDYKGSGWAPFENDHGVSGHAFMGAIPFISAANLIPYPPLKIALYAASTFTGLSRMNDYMHYPSQVLLGWVLAFASCEAISKSNATIILTPNSLVVGTTF
jgi:membrane-associated phospholipid phosphatase